VILPVEQLIELCHKYNILVLIDGAHAMGEIPLNITNMKPDFYLSNGHKWLYSSRGSAILYVDKKYQNITFPVCINDEGQGATSFVRYFNYVGTNDDTAWMSMNSALDFRQQFGDDTIINYMHELAVDGGHLIANIWNTSLITKNNNNVIPAMVNVRLPTQNATEIANIQSILYYKYITYLVTYSFENVWYCRISAQIFLELSDFQWIAYSFLEVMEQLRSQ